MAKRVENRDIFSADLFKKTQSDVSLLIAEIDKLEASLIRLAELEKKALNSQKNDSFESIQKTKNATEKLNKTEILASKIRKEKITLEQKLNQARTKSAKQDAVTRVQIQEQVKLNKSLAREKLNLVGAYSKEAKKLIELRKKYKDLAVAEGDTTKKSKALLRQIQKLDTKLKGIDKTVGQSQRNVGNYGSAWSKVGNVFRGGLGVLGITAGIAGLGRVVSSTIGIFSGFEKANSNLRAVLGGTDEEMLALSTDAKALGSVTAFTASEVTGLQTSLAKLGFPTEEILQMTESTLNASSAMGSDLDATASLTGATLKAFGLDASEAGRVNDVLAKSTSASALDFEKLNASMSTIAPVANAFGFSVEESTALLGQLSNAGFDASSSATATRNILLNLADSNGKLAKSLKEPVTDLPSLVKGLAQLKDEGVDLGEALELTDKRSVAAFQTFLNGTDDLLALNEGLNNAGGTAEQMADTQLDNLSGAVTILGSAWEGFILSLEDGNGAFSRVIRNFVELVTEVLSLLTGTQKLNAEMTRHEKVVRRYAEAFITVVKVVGVLAVAFATYKAVIVTTNAITKVYTITTRLLRIAKIALSRGIGGATKAMKAFNVASKANPIGLIISLLALAVTAWLAFRDSANEAITAVENFEEASKRANDSQKENISERKKGIDEIIRAEELRVRKAIALGGDEKKLNKELADFKKTTFRIEQKAEEKRLKRGIQTSNERIAQNKKELIQIDSDIKSFQENRGNENVKTGGAEADAQLKRLRKQRSELVQENATFAGNVKGTTDAIRDNILAIDNEILEADVKLIETIKDNTKSTKSEMEKRAKELDLLRRKLEDLNNQAIVNDLERQKAVINTKFKREIEAIKGNSQVEIELRIALARERDKQLLEVDEELIKKRNEIFDKAELRFTEDETEKKILGVLQKFDAEVDKINQSQVISEKEKNDLIIQETKRTQDEITKIEADADKKRLDEEKKNDDERQALADKEAEARKKQQEELKQAFEDTIGVISELVDEQFEKRIEAIDKALGKTGERIDDLKQKANEGSLSAQESLAVERKREIELEKEKEQERKRQEKAQAFFSVLTAFNQNDGNIGKTVADVTVLKSLAGQLTAYDGVDDTGGRGNVDSKGGKLWTLHPNEQVWSKADRGDVGFRSRDDIKDIVSLHDAGLSADLLKYDRSNEITPLSLKLNGLGGNADIVNKLNTLNQSIQGIDIPEGMVHIDEVRKLITLHSRKGNKVTKTHSKLFDR